jgi:YVTN family beta-propeller protein
VAPPALLTDALVSSFSLKELIEVDAKTGAVKNQWSTGNGPTDVANKGTEAFVANALSQDITVVDRLANAVSGTIDVTATPITGLSLLSFADPILKPLVRPTGVAFTPAGTKAFSANLLNVTVIDGATHAPIKSILGLAPINLASIISSPSTAISNFLASPVPGLGMAKVAATNDYAMVTCMISGKVMRIDARTNSLVDYTSVGRAPIGITIARNKAYVACALSQDVYVVDVATGIVRTSFKAGMIPVDCSSNQSEDRVYVANAVSGDVSVIDTAADLVIDTLPAGLSVASIFQQLGVTLPSGTSGGIGGLLNGFLQGFTGGMTNPSSFGALLAGSSGGSLLSPANLINGVLSGFLAYAGITQNALAGLNLPALGIFSISVAHDPTYVCSANALMGDLAVTETTSRSVSSLRGLTGMGIADVSAVWRR